MVSPPFYLLGPLATSVANREKVRYGFLGFFLVELATMKEPSKTSVLRTTVTPWPALTGVQLFSRIAGVQENHYIYRVALVAQGIEQRFPKFQKALNGTCEKECFYAFFIVYKRSARFWDR